METNHKQHKLIIDFNEERRENKIVWNKLIEKSRHSCEIFQRSESAKNGKKWRYKLIKIISTT